MAALSPASKKAIASLRSFASGPSNYYKCPLSRRAAVLILLFADRRGDLRVVLTIRSAGLKSYAGQAALPGGKADTLTETPFATARREAYEEIGLPTTDARLPPGYSVEHLTELPANLAMTELGVRPCVAWLKAQHEHADVAKDILPKLDAREVAAVFTAPFYGFLRERDIEETEAEGTWYKGSWHSWHESAWRMHQFFVPIDKRTVFLANPAGHRRSPPSAEAKPEPSASSNSSPGLASSRPKSKDDSGKLKPSLPPAFYTPSTLSQPRYRVFGMTARILVDCARVAYGEEPEYEHNSHFGDEEMIARLLAIGRLSPKRMQGDLLTREVMVKAAKAGTVGENKL